MNPPGRFSVAPPKSHYRKPWLFIGAILSFAGCRDNSAHVTVRVALPLTLSNPAGELLLTRFDLSRVIDSLSTIADVPKPDFSALEQELMDFRPARSEALDSLQSEWFSVRQDVVRLADSLRRIGRDAPGYSGAYDRLRGLHTQVTSRERALEERMGQLVPASRIQLARRAMAAADSLRAWEDQALAGLPTLLDSLTGALGPAVVVQLPADGRFERELATGTWWVAMRISHPENPFLEYYWETSFTLNRWIPVVVPVNERHMTLRWRH